jgi:hypothetical protein
MNKIFCFPVKISLIILGAAILFSVSSCKKDKFNTSGALSFSADTITFDTIFTTLGSTTQLFAIRNTSKQAIKISNISLGGGTASSYRMNVDGDSGTSFTDVEIPAKDSIYVFVEVTVDPNAANLPFIILDSIQFNTNGNHQKVILQAYGQNANFYNADSIETNITWNSTLPYVILNYLQIKQGASLTIPEDCKVYFGGGAAMIVEGDLQVLGTDTTHIVTFRGVRLDKDIAGRPYDDFPGQYAGIFFLRNSTGNLKYLNMRNSAYGINVGNIKTTGNDAADVQTLRNMSINDAPHVTISNSKIYNNAFYGIFGFLGSITAENTLVYNCGKNVVGLYDGGDYKFTHCTFYTRSTAYISHSKDPALYISNYFEIGSQDFIKSDSANADFVNCIVYGPLENEITADELNSNPNKIRLTFHNSVVKTNSSLSFPVYENCRGDDPQFIDLFKNNYKLKGSSPASNLGSFILTEDIDGNLRSNPSDAGAYEIQ